MVSGIEFELGAEDQSKQVHQHFYAFCAYRLHTPRTCIERITYRLRETPQSRGL